MNPGAGVEFHLHQLVPAALTLVVARKLGGGDDPDHWLVREDFAAMCRVICEEFGDRFTDLRPRVVQTLCGALDSDAVRDEILAPAMFSGVGSAALHRYAEPRLTKLAAAFAELPESDDKRRCLDAIECREVCAAPRPGRGFQEQTAGTYVEGEWRAVGEVEPSRPPKRFEKADDVRGGKRKRGHDPGGRSEVGRAARPESKSGIRLFGGARRAGRRARGLRGGGVHLI